MQRILLDRVSASASQVEFIVDDSARAAFRNSAVSATRDILALGVVDVTRMTRVTTDRVTIRETEERSISKLSEDMLTSRDFYDQARLTELEHYSLRCSAKQVKFLATKKLSQKARSILTLPLPAP